MDPDGDGDPSDGIDGWRLDVAFCVSHAFWRAWRQHVRAINPEAYIVGELFGADDVLASYLQGDTFDAAMNYPFAYACYEYFIHEQHRIDTSTFDRKLADLRAAYPACVAEVQQNLLDSHDSNRIGSHIVNRAGANIRQWDAYCQWSSVEKNPSYDTRKPTAEERRLHNLAVLFQMTYLGAPMVYYGDEAGMWGANDPCCRKPMVWPDLSYAPEATRPDGSVAETPDSVTFDRTLFDLYRGLIHLRHNTPALCRGDFATVLVDDAAEVHVF
jgi:glycosidase